MKNVLFYELYYYLMVLLATPISLGFCASDLTDGQKLVAVYEMYSEYKKEFPETKDISAPEAMELMKKDNVLFVDIRKTAEMDVSMLPRAVKKDDFLKRPPQYKGHTIIAYCTIGYRSGKFAEEMSRKGISIFNLRGGILAWVLEGGKVYDEKGETRRVHVYGSKWNYIPNGYESVMFGLF
jgi:rhodanese-related sulfurtransferase